MFGSTSKLVGTATVIGAVAAIAVPNALAQKAWYGPSVSRTQTSAQVSPYLHDSWYLTARTVRASSRNPYGTPAALRARLARINNDNAR